MPSADDLAERQAINKIGSNDVYVRAAKLSDATALIQLNEEFRENMLRWQQEVHPQTSHTHSSQAVMAH